ncbi:conserved exported hypothetical protein [Cupriavidus taiwanensis]|uniref:hypothetical protein n=1 Tax=Cupriavidus taiwanensis TaxID=164546 RepID=UPI000E11EA86|nr:hypothetical protein [Cupriavidus taiwanensis]SPA38601.1 conserved exported hypothetical protein [Cupriavidus taiwanensis]
MINNCRPAVRAFGIALLIAGAGQAYAQLLRGLEPQGLRDRPDACAQAGPASTPAVCRAASEPASSKYNLLYADDALADEGEDESPFHRHAGPARDDAYRGGPRNEATGS